MKLAYLTTCFGTPSHTFIRRELNEFQRRGKSIALYGIRKDQRVAEDAHNLVKNTKYLYPVNWLQTIVLNLFYAVRYAHRYWPTLFSCLNSSGDNFKQRLKLVFHLVISVNHAYDAKRSGVQHIHAHFLNVSSSITMFMSRLSGIPYSITIHSAGEKDLPHVIGIALKLKFASKLLMISEFNIKYYDALYPCRDKSSVVRCGMNIDEFDVRPFQQADKNKPLKMLAVGRFVEKKGFATLIQAASILKDRGFDFRLEILGFGPLHEALENEVKVHHLEQLVSLPGQASTDIVKAKMLDAHVVVVPSVTSKTGEMEGIPVVLMEAMASGVPIIGSKHSGIPELVRENTGDLVNEGDSVALADTIINFQSSSEKVLAARNLIQSEFNIHHVVDQRQAIFEEAL